MRQPLRTRDLGERIFRLLLLVYPPSFRARFGEEMLEFFLDRRLEQMRRGGNGPARLWLHLLGDIAVNAPLLHLHALTARFHAIRPATSHDVPWSSPEYPEETRPMESLWQDVRYAARTLARRPAFVAVAVLTLALGIGATTAIYSVADAVLIQPLPWPAADRLVAVNSVRDGTTLGVVYLDYRDWLAENKSFELLGVIRGQSVNLTGGSAPERLIGMFASASSLHLFGAAVSRGRLPTDIESSVDTKQPVAVVSEGFWRSRMGARDDALGQTLVLNGQPFSVIGVLKAGLQTPFGSPDVWLPMGYYPNKGDLTTRGRVSVSTFGRLKPGVTIAQAQQDLGATAERLAQLYPANAGVTTSIIDLRETIVGPSRAQVFVVLGAVVIVLLIACANVANLQLGRAASRRRELSVRSALGAGRMRLIRQLVTESLILSVAGGVVGMAIAYGGVQWLSAAVPKFLQFFGTIALNPGVLLFSGAVTIGTGLLFALPPAWRASRVRLNDALTVRGADGGRASAFGRGTPLVFAQVALCVVLLVTAGLLGRSLIALTRVNPGFDAEHVLTMQFRVPAAKYDTDDKIAQMFSRSLDELRAVPGVKSAALVRATPLNGNGDLVSYQLDGHGETDPKHLPQLHLNIVSAGYYQTMGITRTAGRDFTPGDRGGALPVVIVNQQLAEKIAPGGSAVGARVKLPVGAALEWFTVVGVVGNAKHFSVSEHQLDQAYMPFTQRPLIFTEVVIRTAGDPAAMGAKAREAIWRVNRDQPVWAVRPLAQSIGNALGSRAFMLRLLISFAVLAVVLAIIGIYGVTSYAVAGRTQEMGIRMALGARAQQVVGLVVRQSMTTIGSAIAIGLVASFGATRLIEAQLFGIRATDPVIYAIVPLVLASVAVIACWVPARRASRVDPVTTLRAD